MAQYFWTAADYSTGQTPSEWGNDIQINSYQVSSDSNGNYLDIDDVDGVRSYLLYLTPGTDIDANAEILCKLQIGTSSGIYPITRFDQASDSTLRADYTSESRISEQDNGTYNIIDNMPNAFARGTVGYIRLGSNGTTIRAKFWAEDNPEPSTWDMTGTTTVTNTGAVGIGIFSSSDVRIYEFSVGTNGDTAPSSDPNPPSNEPAKFVVSGSSDDTVRKIDSGGNEIWSFTGHTNTINGIAIDSNENIYTGSDDDTVRKIDTDGNEIWSYSIPNFTNCDSVDVDDQGNVYAGCDDNILRKLDSTGGLVWEFTGHTDQISGVSVDPTGYVHTASWDDTHRKIDFDGNEIWSFTGHGSNNVIGVDVDSYGNSYSTSTGTVLKVDPVGNQVWSFTGHDSGTGVNSVAVDQNKNVYSGGFDNTVRKIDSSGNQIWSFTGHTNWINGVAVDGQTNVYSASQDDTVRKIDSSGNQVWSFTGHANTVEGIAQFTPPPPEQISSNDNSTINLSYSTTSVEITESIIQIEGNSGQYQTQPQTGTVESGIQLEGQTSTVTTNGQQGEWISVDQHKFPYQGVNDRSLVLTDHLVPFQAQHRVPSNEQGGTISSGDWRTRPLNFVNIEQPWAALSDDQIELLQPGRYWIKSGSIVHRVDLTQTRIQDVTNGVTLLTGISYLTNEPDSDNIGRFCKCYGLIRIFEPITIELQHQCQTTNTTNGFGASGGTPVSDYNVFADIRIWKLSY